VRICKVVGVSAGGAASEMGLSQHLEASKLLEKMKPRYSDLKNAKGDKLNSAARPYVREQKFEV
jgi:hypothetical protein